MNEKGPFTIRKAAQLTGCRYTLLEKLVVEGRIILEDDKISLRDIERIVEENEKYISMYEYAIINTSERFNGEMAKDRNALLDILEENNFFGIQIIDPRNILTGNERDEVFFSRNDISVLDEKLAGFLGLFSLTESEKVKKLIKNTIGNSNTKHFIEKYIHDKMYEQTITPSFTDFVRRVLLASDVYKLTDEEVKDVVHNEMTFETKKFILQWLSFVKKHHRTLYNTVKIKYKESESVPAYSMDTYFELARVFFNAKYIDEHDMIRKALDNHKYAEMWLYLTLYYACGWRAGDVCSGWRYLRLSEHPDGCLGVNVDTLYDDLLYDRIPDETYENVCKYSTGCIEISGQLASKNSDVGENPLLAVITEELYAFYGLVTLIAESHMVRTNEGYMKSSRTTEYQNRMNLYAFFGPDMRNILHNKNLQSRRLNKDFLQSVKNEGKRAGYGGILTSALASYARNHVNYDTIKVYLKDHNLTAETADIVIYFMAQRGVFGFELYQTLLTAYPEAMNKLTMKEQNEVIEQMNVSPLKIEEAQSGPLESEIIKDYFLQGRNDATFEMLKSMYAISQTKGKGKDLGIYCVKRASDEMCSFPEWKSCIANACPYLVFSKYGIIPLLEILKEFKMKENAGDKKAQTVLKKILVPRYLGIINRIIKEFHLDADERYGLKMLKTEVLNE